MDPQIVSFLSSALKSSIQFYAFDKLSSSYLSMDQDGVMRKDFDAVSSKNTTMKQTLDIIYASGFASTRSHEDNFHNLAIMAAAVLSRQFHGDFVVRQWVNWQKHVHVRLLVCEREFKHFYWIWFLCLYLTSYWGYWNPTYLLTSSNQGMPQRQASNNCWNNSSLHPTIFIRWLQSWHLYF